ncbi:MAG: PilZ domain-containing protein [Deltaproteobacteria bacterium]|nr:PilZ domain-containing protein [Deltaproteobacteria bacterium]
MTDKRKYVRAVYETAITITNEGATDAGTSVNISRGGLCVKTDRSYPFGARIELGIDLPGVPETCRIPCIVRWVSPENAVGLQFENLRAIELWALNKLMHTLGEVEP